MNPAEEARVDVTRGVGEDERPQIVADLLQRLPFDRERCVECLLNRIGNGSSDRAFADVADEVDA